MSLSTALNSAVTGLVAAGRASNVVADNIANVQTPGYARRTLELASNQANGAGVQVKGIQRQADPGIIATRRSAEATYGAEQAMARFHTRFADIVGSPDQAGSLGSMLSRFESSLITAASRPDSALRLEDVLQGAKDLNRAINSAASGVEALRNDAERSIGKQVDTLNSSLREVQKLNVRITTVQASGGETAGLMDQRQLLIDGINEIMPVKIIKRPHDQIALMNAAGNILLDGQPAQIEFTQTPMVVPEMFVEDGTLSGLSINGIPVRTDSDRSALSGGTLVAQFQIRDELAVEAQVALDRMAGDLIQRFENPMVDPTLAPGAPGLFTDAGAVFDPAMEVGLSGRLTLNAAVDPSQGGETWRLRDGLGAATPGPSGDAQQLQRFSDALTSVRVQTDGPLGPGSFSASGLSSAVMSFAGHARERSDMTLTRSAAVFTEAQRTELAGGVDTDQELQTLMQVERAYAASARVVEVVDGLLEQLLRI